MAIKGSVLMAAVALAASAGVSASSLIQNGSFETATFDPEVLRR